jgi:molecular chaperone HscA
MTLLKIEEPQKNIQEQNSQEIPVFGIDFGTTNSLIGLIMNEQVWFFKDKLGKELHKSVVAFDDDGNFALACNEADFSDFNNKIYSVKRLFGKGLQDVDGDEFVEENGALKIKIGKKKYLPAEIAAKIFLYLKNLALKSLDFNDDAKFKAVITVPAYFDESAKNATKFAAELAGFEVLRLVNEPTAAALAYGLDGDKEGIYGVYDLGGGTFDASILKMQKGVFKVLGVSGDNNLGGDDFDDLIAENLGVDKKYAKKIKENFAFSKLYEDEKVKLSYEEFTKIIEPKIIKTIKIVEKLIEDLKLEIGDEKRDIKGVILVGGSSRILLIQEKLREIFDTKIFTDLDPDKVVAQGAVLQAFNLSDKGNNLLLDVLPLSLGIEMMGGIVDKIIHRNTTIPIAMAKEFTTYADNQTGIKFKIVQGEREFAKDCRELAMFEVKGIPPLRAGLAKVLVTFKVDADGLLTVTAKEKISGNEIEIAVKPSFGLDEAQIKNALLDSMKNAKEDINLRLRFEALNEARQNAEFLRRDLKEYGDLISDEEISVMKSDLKNLDKVIAKKDSSRDEIIAAQKRLEQSSERFALEKMNKSLERYVDKNVDEV